VNLRYEFARLGTDYFLGRFSDQYKKNQRLPPPRYVIWDCSRRCNLHCSHCGATKEVYERELTTEQITTVVDELAALKVAMFAVTGGEPLLRKDLLDVLSCAAAGGLQTGLATNGFFIDDAMAKCIKAAKVSSIQVSLDGLERTHNAIRGNAASFARAVNAVKLLVEQRIPSVSIATTVTPQNIHELESLRGLVRDLGVKGWRLTVVMPIGRAGDAGLSLNPGQLVSLFEFVRASRAIGVKAYVGENLTFLGDWEKRIRNAPLICPVGFTACCIGVDGHIRGCPEQPDVSENREGSVLNKTFSEIWQRGFGKYRQRIVLETDENCSACKSKQYCYGGCWVMRQGDLHCIHHLIPATQGEVC